MSWRIPLSDLNYGPEEESAVMQVLRSKWLTMGPKTEEFEGMVADYLGVKHAVALANCTCALEIAYRFVIEQRLENRDAASSRPTFVMPSLTFVATANAAVVTGGAAAFADISSASQPVMNLQRTEAALDAIGDSVAGVTIVHFAGFDADTDSYVALCRERGIPLIEDAAHAIGSRTARGNALGTSGVAGCFSFFSNKNLATGEGGMIATNDAAVSEFAKSMRSHGVTAGTYQRHFGKSHGYDVVRVGHNYRCTEISAALGIEQLRKLDAGNRRRRELYARYCDAFRDESALTTPYSGEPDMIAQSACHVFPLVCESAETRDHVRQALSDRGIQTSHHYPPIHTLSGYPAGPGQSSPAGQALEMTESFAEREITLPLHPKLSDDEADEVCEAVLSAVRSRKSATIPQG